MATPTLEYLITAEQLELLMFVDGQSKIDSYRDLYSTGTRIQVFTTEWSEAQEALDNGHDVEYFPLRNDSAWNSVSKDHPTADVYLYTVGDDEGMYGITIDESINSLRYAFVFNQTLDDEKLEEFFLMIDASSYTYQQATITDGDDTSTVWVAILEENI